MTTIKNPDHVLHELHPWDEVMRTSLGTPTY